MLDVRTVAGQRNSKANLQNGPENINGKRTWHTLIVEAICGKLMHMKRPALLLAILFLFSMSQAVGQDTKENADFKLAVNLYNDKLYDLALEQFRQFVATFPNTQQGIEARFYLGLSQTRQGKFDVG
jgi:TolA-binding protein